MLHALISLLRYLPVKISHSVSFPLLLCYQSVQVCNYFSVLLLLSWWFRSSCRSSGLSWRSCRICSSVSQKHWGVRRMSGYSWRSEPKLCSNRLWNRKWLLRGGSRFVVLICCWRDKFTHKDKWNFLWGHLAWFGAFVLTLQMLKPMAAPAAGVEPLGG